MNWLPNDELRAAIAWTSQRVREVAPNEPQYAALNAHLVKLLDEQARRAAAAKPNEGKK